MQFVQGELQPSSKSLSEPALQSLHPLPELAAALRSGVGEASGAWLEVARRHVPSLASLNEAQALNGLPDALEAIAQALAGDGSENERLGLIGGTHGLTRVHQGVVAVEFALEYPLLRQVLVRMLREKLGRELRSEEADALHTLVDRLIQLSSAAYTTLQEKEIRLENEATGRHLAMMSHDLRNTLNAALLSMQMVRERLRDIEPNGPPDLPELLADMDDCRRMAMGAVESMTRVLDAERLRAGRVPLSIQAVDLCTLLGSVRTTSVRASATGADDDPAADAEPQVEIQCRDGTVARTDPDLLSTILQNLLGNAIRYAGDKPIRVVVEEPADDGIRISVIDQGPGIEPGQLETIFGLFRRGTQQSPEIPAARRQPAYVAGSGLGLYIARRAAELLEARLDVRSEPGKGAAFILSLPKASRVGA